MCRGLIFSPSAIGRACLVCQAIAERYSRTSDSTISSDSVDHTSRAQEFASRAREYCRMYAQHIEGVTALADGAGEGSHDPMSVQIDLDVTPGYAHERDFLFHGGRSR